MIRLVNYRQGKRWLPLWGIWEEDLMVGMPNIPQSQNR